MSMNAQKAVLKTPIVVWRHSLVRMVLHVFPLISHHPRGTTRFACKCRPGYQGVYCEISDKDENSHAVESVFQQSGS